MRIPHFWAVIPAGGAGTRLWPLSRSSSPKFLHDLTGNGMSLLQDTVDRLTPFAEDRMILVTGTDHRDAVLEQLDVDARSVLAEPSPRDSMAAIGLAAAVIERQDPDAVMGSFAADQVVTETAAFAEAVHTAARVARDGWLVTLGIEPTHASTAFGYIHLGDPLEGHEGAHGVVEFVEKPDTDIATEYLTTGRYRWNAGMFVVRPTVLLDLLATWHPEFAASLRAIAADLSRLDELWADLPKIAIDHAVAEPAAALGRVAVVPCAIGWDDVGDYDSLATLLGDDATAVAVLGDASQVVALDATGLVVPGSGRTVAVLGLDDIVVVDTPDAVLVTTRARAQELKRLVTALQEGGRGSLT